MCILLPNLPNLLIRTYVFAKRIWCSTQRQRGHPQKVSDFFATFSPDHIQFFPCDSWPYQLNFGFPIGPYWQEWDLNLCHPKGIVKVQLCWLILRYRANSSGNNKFKSQNFSNFGHSNMGALYIYVNRIFSFFDHLPTSSKHTQ